MAVLPRYDYFFKIFIVGDFAVGKTSLMYRFANDCYFPTMFVSKIGVDFLTKNYVIDDIHVKLQIWDTAGQERFRTVYDRCYRGMNGFIVAYDVTDPKSFERVNYWLYEIERNCDDAAAKECVILAGNKNDAVDNKSTSTQDAELFSHQRNLPFFETSAATGEQVEEIFTQLTRMCVGAAKRYNHQPFTNTNTNNDKDIICLNADSLTNPDNEKKCC